MFARIFALLPLALLASASHLAARTAKECNTGNQFCCNNAFTGGQISESHSIATLVSAVVAVAAHAGVTCSAIAVTDCTQQPVCCSDVKQNGLINVACSPINVA